MIPLSDTEGVEKFPRFSLGLCLALLVLNILAYFVDPWMASQIGRAAAGDNTSYVLSSFLASIYSPSLFKLLVNLVFVWVFSPKLFERRPIFFCLLLAWLGSVLARESFFRIHSQFVGPLPAFDAWVGVLLGMSLRTEIWASVSTLVVGWGWLRVFDVPSYVLLFFWLFYLFLGNLFLKPLYAEAPMLYLLPFVGLMCGFFGDFVFEFLPKKSNT